MSRKAPVPGKVQMTVRAKETMTPLCQKVNDRESTLRVSQELLGDNNNIKPIQGLQVEPAQLGAM